MRFLCAFILALPATGLTLAAPESLAVCPSIFAALCRSLSLTCYPGFHLLWDIWTLQIDEICSDGDTDFRLKERGTTNNVCPKMKGCNEVTEKGEPLSPFHYYKFFTG